MRPSAGQSHRLAGRRAVDERGVGDGGAEGGVGGVGGRGGALREAVGLHGASEKGLVLWEYSYKRLKLAQLLGQLGAFLTAAEGRLTRRSRAGDARRARNNWHHQALLTKVALLRILQLLLL